MERKGLWPPTPLHSRAWRKNPPIVEALGPGLYIKRDSSMFDGFGGLTDIRYWRKENGWFKNKEQVGFTVGAPQGSDHNVTNFLLGTHKSWQLRIIVNGSGRGGMAGVAFSTASP